MGVLSFSFLFLFLFQSFLCHEQEKDECIEPQQNENFVGEEVEREKIPQEEEEREEREREEEEKEKEDSFKSGIGRIHWVHECGCTGMHVEAMNYIVPLIENGVDVTVNDCDGNYCQESHKKLFENRISKNIPKEKSIIILHFAFHGPCPLLSEYEYDEDLHYVIARSMYEATAISSESVQRCNSDQISEIWVPSPFSEETFINSGVNPSKIRILHETINTTLFSPLDEEEYDLEIEGKDLETLEKTTQEDIISLKKKGKNLFQKAKNFYDFEVGKKREEVSLFLYLSVFKFEERKNWRCLIESFVALYDSGVRDIALLIKTSKYMGSDPFRTMRGFVAQSLMKKRLFPIFIFDDFMSEIEIRNFYSIGNSFVLPTRGEGWGLPIMEAMAMGLPVIVTNFSGHTTFVNEKNSFLIPVSKLSTASGNGLWAETSTTTTISLMKSAKQYPIISKRKALNARLSVLDHFSPSQVVKSLLDLLFDAKLNWIKKEILN